MERGITQHAEANEAIFNINVVGHTYVPKIVILHVTRMYFLVGKLF